VVKRATRLGEVFGGYPNVPPGKLPKLSVSGHLHMKDVLALLPGALEMDPSDLFEALVALFNAGESRVWVFGSTFRVLVSTSTGASAVLSAVVGEGGEVTAIANAFLLDAGGETLHRLFHLVQRGARLPLPFGRPGSMPWAIGALVSGKTTTPALFEALRVAIGVALGRRRIGGLVDLLVSVGAHPAIIMLAVKCYGVVSSVVHRGADMRDAAVMLAQLVELPPSPPKVAEDEIRRELDDIRGQMSRITLVPTALPPSWGESVSSEYFWNSVHAKAVRVAKPGEQAAVRRGLCWLMAAALDGVVNGFAVERLARLCDEVALAERVEKLCADMECRRGADDSVLATALTSVAALIKALE